MRYALIISVIILVVALAGCAKYVPFETQKLAVPKECKARHYADLPDVAPMTGPNVTPDQVNKHWAKAHRLQSRPAYRRLYRNYRVCSAYAKRS
jgi:hypothetical protein